MSHDPQDEKQRDPELDVTASEGDEPKDIDPEPDFELHGQFFDAPSQ